MVIFIANEESSATSGIGVDKLSEEGYMDSLRAGPVFWVDSADAEPCVGTSGVLQWQLDVNGKLFHSGLPHHGINSIEMGFDVIHYIQKKFYSRFPKHDLEDAYNFRSCSTLKATQVETSVGSLNQLPAKCTLRGDVRLSPFYDIADVRLFLEECVRDINNEPESIDSKLHGPHSKYELPEENIKGNVQLTFISPGENGIACSLESPGYKAIVEATRAVSGSVKPYSMGGFLPLVRDLKDKGFDVQICGFGQSDRYHANNESASLAGFHKAAKIIAKVCYSFHSNQ